MKLLTNKQDPRNRIIVVDAYFNDDLIVCDANSDDFDLWEDCWTIEDLEDEPINPFDTKLFQDGVKEGRRLEREDIKKEQKPASSGSSEKPNNLLWSDEDENNLELVIDCIYKFYPDPVMKYKLKEWLKSLRSRPKPSDNWKPSDEQREH